MVLYVIVCSASMTACFNIFIPLEISDISLTFHVMSHDITYQFFGYLRGCLKGKVDMLMYSQPIFLALYDMQDFVQDLILYIGNRLH